MNPRSPLHQTGFALLEALIAAAIIAFGLFAIAKWQVGLFGNSDIAKQRTEAVTLGEKKIEELRSYSQLPTDTTGIPPKRAYQDIVSSNDTVAGANASYTRTWAITDVNPAAATYAAYKNLAMTVTWFTRTSSSTPETITLNSMIALSDPAATGLTAVPPAGTPTRKPKNRNINIPIPAVKLGGGVSAYRPPGSASGTAVIFDDVTANVTATCTTATIPGTDYITGTPTSTAGWTCTSMTGLFLSGFIGHADTSSPITFHLTPQLTANSGGGGTATLFGCWDDVASELYPGFVTYSCVINTSSSQGMWSGTTTFSPSSVAWGTLRDQWAICRYVYEDGTTYPYSNVDHTLLDQNYILEPGRNSNFACPVQPSGNQPYETVLSYAG